MHVVANDVVRKMREVNAGCDLQRFLGRAWIAAARACGLDAQRGHSSVQGEHLQRRAGVLWLMSGHDRKALRLSARRGQFEAQTAAALPGLRFFIQQMQGARIDCIAA